MHYLWRLWRGFGKFETPFQSTLLYPASTNPVHKLVKMPFYAVARGRATGIYNSWTDCEAQVKGFSGAKYKKFDTAFAANEFVHANGFGRETYANTSTSNGKSSWSNNLKRPYSSSSYNGPNYFYNKKSKTDSSEDGLEDIITKQLDDMDKRIKTFSKGLDKLTKNAPKVPGNKPKQTILIEPHQQRSYNRNNNFEEDGDGYVQVYTDGACSANGAQDARAGLGVYWGDNHQFNRSQPVSGRATNNCGEIQAATLAIKTAHQNGVKKLAINTDSQFLINSVTKWLPGWKRRGWTLSSGQPVKNEKDFKELDSVLNKVEIKWNYVKAHNGLYGNEMADKLAKAGAALYDK